MFVNSLIESSGSYIPDDVVTNQDFLGHTFLDGEGNPLSKPTDQIVTKLEEITQIKERHYDTQHDTCHMATEAAKAAFSTSSVALEEIDGIIVAHNFGNIMPGEHQGHLVPNLASKVKNALGISNSRCFAYDVLYGCPGWLLGLYQAHQYIQFGDAQSVLVIGVESLSRVVDPHDVDSMLFGDGAGAVILKREEAEVKRGVLGYDNYSDCLEEVDYLRMGKSRVEGPTELYVHMIGRSVFKYGVGKMPGLITEHLQRLQIPIEEIALFLFHQANGKMLDAIGDQISQLNGIESIKEKAPITLDKYGNTSVATIPTMIDLIQRDQLNGFKFQEGQKVVMASVGAGMHVNCMAYQF